MWVCGSASPPTLAELGPGHACSLVLCVWRSQLPAWLQDEAGSEAEHEALERPDPFATCGFILFPVWKNN